MRKKIFIVLGTFFTAVVGSAHVYIAPDVQGWMNSSTTVPVEIKNSSELKLLVLLKSSMTDTFSTQKKQNLLTSQLNKLRQDFDFFKERKTDLLWAANGFFVNLKKDELNHLVENNQIKAVFNAERKIKLPKPILGSKFLVKFNVDFTYGLRNIKVPDLKKSRPELDGSGIKVGILDTGIYSEHPDLKGRLNRFKNFSPTEEQTPEDGFGHGSHVSGTIAGGSTSGLAIGVAPKADLVVGRIFDGDGESTLELILKSMQWMLDPDENPLTTDDRPKVVNSSWGDDAPYNDRDPEDDPFCLVIETWLKAGIVPVFSAGNSGPKPNSINIPGACPGSFTVGATEQSDRSPNFSSEGPAQWKTVEILKPDVVAPGMDIKSVGNYGDEYEVMSGTSMSAPHVWGICIVVSIEAVFVEY